MTTYQEYRKNRQAQYDNWSDKYAFYAFSDEQFKKGMDKFDLPMNDEGFSKIYRGTAGMFYLKEGSDALKEFMNSDNIHELMESDDEFAIGAFRYEMGNHEYFINLQGDWDVCSCFCDCDYKEYADYRDYLKEGGYSEHVIDLYRTARKQERQYWIDNDYM